MEALPLVLLLNLLWNNGAAVPLGARTRLTIHPEEPLVEVGSSIQLVCSMDCPGGKVQWEGLDTDLADVVSNHTSSILTVSKAAVRMGGMKICTGQCGGKSLQKTVELQVYSLPDTLRLDSQPEVPRAGQPARLLCSVSHVYPPDAFRLTWFQGDDRVERSNTEEDLEDSDLSTFHSKLEIPVAAEHTTYRCEAELQIGEHRFLRSGTVTAHAQAAQEIPTTTEATLTQTAITTSHLGTPERPGPAAHGNSSREATPGRLLPLPSPEHPTLLPLVALLTSPTVGRNPPTTAQLPLEKAVTGSSVPEDGSPSTAERHTAWTSRETSATSGVMSKAIPTSDRLSDTELVSTTNRLATESSPAMERPQNHTLTEVPTAEGPCRPVITLFPPQGTAGGTLRITCHARECHEGVQVRWEETPVALSQYTQEEAAGQSTLAVDSVRLEHQGVYRCSAMTSQPRVASLQVVVETATLGTDTIITIGAAGSLLGLIVTSYVSQKLWQRRGSYHYM